MQLWALITFLGLAGPSLGLLLSIWTDKTKPLVIYEALGMEYLGAVIYQQSAGKVP